MSRARALAMVAMVAASQAHAEPAAALVASAATQWAELEYEKVIELADAALAAPELGPRDRVEALRLKGSALVVLDRADDAARTFEQIFAIEPGYELPAKTSPRILAVFEPARARWQVSVEQRLATELGGGLAAHQLRVRLPPSPRGGLPLAITVDVVDPSAIASSIALSYRREGATYYTTAVSTARAGELAVVLPAEVTASDQPYTLELYVQSRHASGVTLRREGAADRPLRLAVAAGRVPVATPITRRWWFWAGVGALAIGGALLVDQARDVGPQSVVLPPR